MKQNQKSLAAVLALGATLAMPLAFAQSTNANANADSAQQQTGAAAQAAAPATSATPATPATPASEGTAATPATPATPATSATPVKKSWSELDVDQNGSLSVTEAQPVNSLSKVFVQADANADGQLSPDEYKAYLAANGKGQAKSGSGG